MYYIRYGRCEARIADGSTADGYATFSGYASTNDTTTNRWGLIQELNGAYQVKGLVIFGYTTAVDFRDSNKSLFIQNTSKVSANFNAFEVRQGLSRVDLTSISITALGTVSRGNWITTDNATVNLISCTFTDMGTFGFLSGTTATTVTFRRCNLVTQSTATITSCTFDSTNDSVKALLCNDPSKITLTQFTSSGTKHGLELTSATAGNTYTFNGNKFTGYSGTPGSNLVSSSGSNDAAIYNNSGGAVTLNITNGGDTPSVRNGAGATTTINNNVSVTVTIIDQSGSAIPGVEVAIFQDNASRTVVLASTATNASGQVSTSAAASLGTIIIRARQSTNKATFNTGTGVATATDIITTDGTNHKFQTGDAITYSRNGGSVDIGPEPGTYYINRISDTTLYLYDTVANAIVGTATGRQDLTSTGSETHHLDPIRYVPASASGTISTGAFSTQITMLTDSIATG
jgi:hypothetical protein